MARLFEFFLSATAWLRDRLFGALKVHFDSCKLLGSRSQPAIWLEGVWIENTTSQNHFVSDIKVELTEPVIAHTKETDWRRRGRASERTEKVVNIPPFSRSEKWDILVRLDRELPSPSGNFRGSVWAVGREGFRARRTAISGENFQIDDK